MTAAAQHAVQGPLTVEAELALAALHVGHSHRILLAAESLDGLQQQGRRQGSDTVSE